MFYRFAQHSSTAPTAARKLVVERRDIDEAARYPFRNQREYVRSLHASVGSVNYCPGGRGEWQASQSDHAGHSDCAFNDDESTTEATTFDGDQHVDVVVLGG